MKIPNEVLEVMVCLAKFDTCLNLVSLKEAYRAVGGKLPKGMENNKYKLIDKVREDTEFMGTEVEDIVYDGENEEKLIKFRIEQTERIWTGYYFKLVKEEN